MTEKPCCYLATVDITALTAGYSAYQMDLREVLRLNKRRVPSDRWREMVLRAWENRKEVKLLNLAVKIHLEEHLQE